MASIWKKSLARRAKRRIRDEGEERIREENREGKVRVYGAGREVTRFNPRAENGRKGDEKGAERVSQSGLVSPQVPSPSFLSFLPTI